MADRFTLNVYGDKTLEDKFNRVKEYFVAKDPGINWTNSAVGAGAIDYVYQKIVGQETNANRITTIVEQQLAQLAAQARQDERQAQVEDRLTRLEATVNALVATVEQLLEEIRSGSEVTDEPAT